MRYLVYGLVDPRTDEVRYIGKSKSGLKRPRAHGERSRMRQDWHSHKNNWIRSLQAQGLSYKIKVLEEVSDAAGLSDIECFWIAQGWGLGWPLTNLTKGGDGFTGDFSAEHRRKLSEAGMGRRQTPESKAKISAAKRGKPRSPEAVEKMRATKLAQGASIAERTRALWEDPKFFERARAPHRTPEAKAARSAQFKAMWADPEKRAQILAARAKAKGRK